MREITLDSNEGNIINFSFTTPENLPELWEKFQNAYYLEKIGRYAYDSDDQVTTFSIQDADPVKFDTSTVEDLAIEFCQDADLDSIVVSWIPYINALDNGYQLVVDQNGIDEEYTRATLVFQCQ
jgi:hypothetical protein